MSLVSQLPGQGLPIEAHPEAVLAYVDLLDRVLEDRRLTTDEVAALTQLATAWGLASSAALAIHHFYFSGLARAALADGILTDLERADLIVMAGLLGVPDALNDLRATASGTAVGVNRSSELRGKTVCFTGESVCSIGGVPLDRTGQQQLARGAGLTPVDSVTKHTDILVLADATSMSGKAKKADAYGVRKIGERTFWADLGVGVDGC
jgi:DNA polymerase-3 subunit epsilon